MKDIKLDDRYAYLDLGNGNLLCLGTREEVQDADIYLLNHMIYTAFVIDAYHAIKGSTGLVVH